MKEEKFLFRKGLWLGCINNFFINFFFWNTLFFSFFSFFFVQILQFNYRRLRVRTSIFIIELCKKLRIPFQDSREKFVNELKPVRFQFRYYAFHQLFNFFFIRLLSSTILWAQTRELISSFLAGFPRKLQIHLMLIH